MLDSTRGIIMIQELIMKCTLSGPKEFRKIRKYTKDLIKLIRMKEKMFSNLLPGFGISTVVNTLLLVYSA